MRRADEEMHLISEMFTAKTPGALTAKVSRAVAGACLVLDVRERTGGDGVRTARYIVETEPLVREALRRYVAEDVAAWELLDGGAVHLRRRADLPGRDPDEGGSFLCGETAEQPRRLVEGLPDVEAVDEDLARGELKPAGPHYCRGCFRGPVWRGIAGDDLVVLPREAEE